MVVAALILIVPKNSPKIIEKPNPENQQTQTIPETQISEAPPSVPEIPKEALIKMSFVSQAPFADWNEPWQNACEEASINMVWYYLNDKNMTKENMRDDILTMVDFQLKNWGGHHDIDAEKTLDLAGKTYGLKGEVITEYSVESIKKLIASGIPVILPTDGILLNNPNFRGDGPPYHMLVIKGYDGKNFITNDPGTRLGEGYKYPYQTIIDSVKNPDGGAKELLILTK